MKGDKLHPAQSILRLWLKAGLLGFYRDISIEGREYIPLKGPVIFAPNHNNALIDALLVVCFSRRLPVFLTRADVFQRPLLRKLFSFLNMVPVYRTHDGVDIRTMNEPVFDQMADALEAGASILIFPEGDKGKDYQLLPLKKGMARIAFRALKREGCTEVPIVPMGITYEWMYRPGARVVVRFGEPILASAFRSGDEQQDLRQLTDAVASALKPLMHHLPADRVPEMHEAVKAMDTHRTFNGQLGEAYEAILSSNKWADGSKQERKSMSGMMMVGVRVLFWLLHLPPYGLALWLTGRLSRHPHFYTSILFGMLLVLVPMWWLLIAGIAIWLVFCF